MKFSDESRSDWVETSHPQVFYRSEDDRLHRGEFTLGKMIADHLPGWTLVIEMGHNRETEILFEICENRNVIHMDCDVIGPASYQALKSEHHQRDAVKAAMNIIYTVIAIED